MEAKILNAISTRDLEAFTDCLAVGSWYFHTPMNWRGKNRTITPYEYTIKLRWHAAIEQMLTFGIRTVLDQRSGILTAVASRDLKGIELVLTVEADLIDRRVEGISPLDQAVRMGRMDIVQILLQHGAGFHCGSTPIMSAIRLENFEILKLLSTHRPEIISQPDNGKSLDPVPFMVQFSSLPMLELIHAWHPRFMECPNSDIFNLAIQRGDLEILNWLFQHVSIRSNRYINGRPSKRPMMLAIDMNRLDLVQWLLDAGVNLNLEDTYEYFHLAVKKGYVDIATVLLRAAPKFLMSKDYFGMLPINIAIQSKSLPMLQLIVEAILGHEDPSARLELHSFRRGVNLMHQVVPQGAPEMIEYSKLIYIFKI